MTQIRIVTDSDVRLSNPGLLTDHQVALAPVVIQSNGTLLPDQPDVRLEFLQSYFRPPNHIPFVLSPSMEQIAEIYRQLQGETDQIISIHTSRSITQTYENAVKASEEFRGRCDIQVIDSESMSVGLGMLVQAAVESIAKGAQFEETVRIIRGMIPRLYLVFFLEDLFYLEKNKLVSKSQALLGNMLGIIPFLTIEHGRMIPMEKVRSRPRALEKLVEFVSEFSITEQLAVLHHAESPDEEALIVGERLQGIYPQTSISFLQYSPSVATHIGLNGLGVAVLESQEEAL